MKEKIEKWLNTLIIARTAVNNLSALDGEDIAVMELPDYIHFSSGLRTVAQVLGLPITEKEFTTSYSKGQYREITTRYKGVKLVELEDIEK